jgi:hypothetical protein
MPHRRADRHADACAEPHDDGFASRRERVGEQPGDALRQRLSLLGGADPRPDEHEWVARFAGCGITSAQVMDEPSRDRLTYLIRDLASVLRGDLLELVDPRVGDGRALTGAVRQGQRLPQPIGEQGATGQTRQRVAKALAVA